jgi:eukaryotic-like serine/threonine-protein kinase
MTSEANRWQRVRQVFHATIERPDADRARFLREACTGDSDLQREVESLLDAHGAAAGHFMESPAIEGLGASAADRVLNAARNSTGRSVPGQRAAMQPIATGTRLGPYEIVGLVGAGGMGEVYRAHDSQLGRDVAIKVLPLELANDPDRLSRFDREARALAALNHPNIATIHGIAQTAEAASSGQASVRAIVLELVEGPTLSERLARGPVPLDEALAIARQIAEALDAAHEKGIIHRDLKPSNIKIRPDGGVKVLDFGLAKLVNHVDGTSDFDGTEPLAVAATQPGLVIGTAAYMSPEQARGGQVDKRTDIWAFGCVLYEMLAARPAFGGATTSDTMASVLEREPDWSAMSPHTPADVMSLVQRCLDKDVRHRLRDIGDSQRVLSGIGDARQSTPVERLASTQRALPWIAAVAALAAVALGVWFLRLSAPAGVPIQTTHSQITIPDNGTIAAGFSNTLAVAPDGRKIAMVVEVNQKTGVWVKALEESTARFVPGSDGAQFVLWSPDSKSLAFRVLFKLLRFDLASSAPAVIAPVPRRGPTFGADWGDDGTSSGAILFNGPTGVMRVSGSGGEPVAIGVTDAFHPQMLPHGRFFYTSVQKAAVFGALFDHPAASVEILKEDAAPVYAPRAGEIGKRGDGFLLWIRGTTLLAQAFDPSTMRLAGESMVLANPAGTVAVSSSLLLYDPAPAISQLAWVDRNGKVMQLVGDPAAFGYATLSPDGIRVVVAVRTNAGIPATKLFTLDTRRGGLNRLVDIGGNTSPVWSPDGQTVLFGSDKGLTRIATSGVGDPDVVHPFPRRINPTDWSRRGFVLFNQVGLGTEPYDPSTEMNIMMLPVTPDGKPAGEATPYLQKPGAQREARFSPDGGWVAYEESDESGQSEVFVDTFPERRRAIQISTNGGFGARWNPQGGEVFYRSPAGKLMGVSLKMDKNSADVSTPRELFTLPVSTIANLSSQYDVGPDGKRFLIQVPVKKAPLELITNWQALLK